MVDFAALGFDITMRTAGVIDINGIPSDIGAENIDSTIYQLLQTLSLPHEVENIRREQLALTLAQSQSAKRTQYTQADAEAIAPQLVECSDFKHTPSGKSIMTFITIEDIQQLLA